MKIAPVTPNLSFKRRLTISEEKEMERVNAQAKELLGSTGNSVLIVHDACLPQGAGRNTGVSNILTPDASAFFDFAKTYFGINTVEVLPQGEFMRKHDSGLVCAYGYSALGLNDSLIDTESLTTPKWKKILRPEEFKEIVESNRAVDKASTVNFENINSSNSAFDKNLRKAFGRFIALTPDDELKVAFDKYKKENEAWLTPKIVYRALEKENDGKDFREWPRIDQELYSSKSAFPADMRQARIDSLLARDPKEAEFFRFKQFLADSHLEEGCEILHQKGLKLFGDMPIKFSRDEVWANPEAFLRGKSVGANDWAAPCLNYQALSDENSAAAKLLRLKAGLSARRYDGTRIDVSWMYISPKITDKATGQVEHLDLGDTALKIIEDEYKRVQGANYSPQNIIHEFKAGGSDFSMFRGGVIRPEVASRVAILESEHLHSDWGYADYYFKTLGMSADSVIFGVGDHTAQPLRQIALGLVDRVAEDKGEGPVIRINTQGPVLAKIFNDTPENMMRPENFIRAKFADIMGAKHNFMFYMDPLGMISRFDSQGLNNYENYRFKIPTDYQAQYHRALQRGCALNLPDVLAKAFEKAGLADSHPEIYKKLCNFGAILKEHETFTSGDKLDLKNTSNGLGLKKWGLIGGAACAVAALCLLGYKHFASREAA